MTTDELKELALELRLQLQRNPTMKMAYKIAYVIQNIKHSDGTDLTTQEKDIIIYYLQLPTEHSTSTRRQRSEPLFLACICNVELLKLIEIIKKIIKEGK